MLKWADILTANFPLVSEAVSNYFLTEAEVVKYLEECETGPWLYLLAMEAMLFSPYYAIFNDEEKDKKLTKVKFKSKYLTETFVTLQHRIEKTDFSKLQKAYKRAIGIVTGSTKNVVIGAVGTTVAIAATGGLAFMFAPAIATALVGEAAAGLSGAAIVSYSLAAVGGGSLAAGGLGMAGGTAIITGGGALVGMLGGTGISAATTVNLLADDGYVLSECCKLITFSKAVLIDKYHAISELNEIRAKVESRMDDVQNQIESFSNLADSEDDERKKKEMKLKVRIAKKSIKYLTRTSAELKNIAETEKPNKRKK